MKRLYRSRQSCIIAGVCGGIAEYFNIDPSIVRDSCRAAEHRQHRNPAPLFTVSLHC